ncbi:acetate/propionate family kinase [Nocardiopsis trehalosi]|jgi:acetate kinase|uniref:acetate/propionate family kinase n=1 Tax=Nocardiopsis trehalosi TaxID=109329 RepID=UPI000832F69C|nr:acetate kinase [Nocardiopsis trehalosi]
MTDDSGRGDAGRDAPTVLVLNSGSSSIKYRLLDMAARASLASGSVDRIGEERGTLVHRVPGDDPVERPGHHADHEAALRAVLDAFDERGPDLGAAGLTAVGHRVVHGGDRFAAPVVVDDGVLAAVGELEPLAPLHNPANLLGIRTAMKAFPLVPHVAVFDTAFHQTLPPAAHTYAVPREWRVDHGVRRYGFHGTSHAYVSRRAGELLGRADANVIVLHLGNGASAAAVAAGRSVDTSMGLTPLEGLVMGTRSGDVDPALAAYLARTAGLSAEEVDTALNREGGMRALAGANDMREVWAAVDRGDREAELAVEVYCHRLRKYIGAYFAVLGRVDALVFTAGVGENDARTRERALRGMERFGLRIDPRRNAAPGGGERAVSPEGAEVPVLVVPTDEELEIAAQALDLLGGDRAAATDE